jgi:hypothetical protein
LASYRAYGTGLQSNFDPGLVAYYQSAISKTFDLVQYEGSYVQTYGTVALGGGPKITSMVTGGSPTVLTLQNDAWGLQMSAVVGMTVVIAGGSCPSWAAGTFTVSAVGAGASSNQVTVNLNSTGQTYTANKCTMTYQPITVSISGNSGTSRGALSQLCTLTLATPLYITPKEVIGTVTVAGATSGNGNYSVWSASSDGLTITLRDFSCPSALGGSPTLKASLQLWINSFRAASKLLPNPSTEYTTVQNYIVQNNSMFIANGGTLPSIFDLAGRGAFETFDPDIFSSPNPNWPAFLALSGGQYPFLLKRDFDPAANNYTPMWLNEAA